MTSQRTMTPEVAAAAKAKQMAERARIGANIKHARAQAGLSLRDLEQLAHVIANHLSELERGLRSASVDCLVLIALGLSTTVSRLVAVNPKVASPAAESPNATKSAKAPDLIGR